MVCQMTDTKRIEAIAEAMYNSQKVKQQVRWDSLPRALAADEINKWLKLAQTAISAAPVTEDVKRLVGLLRYWLPQKMPIPHGNDAVCRVVHSRWHEAQNELKKWNGE